jgi:hypothetical protein
MPRALFSVVNGPERETNHLPSINVSIHTLPRTISWNDAKLVKHRGKFTLYFPEIFIPEISSLTVSLLSEYIYLLSASEKHIN